MVTPGETGGIGMEGTGIVLRWRVVVAPGETGAIGVKEEGNVLW